MTQAHPNPIQIFQLWQIYIDNINSLLKITHVPTVQPQILQAASSLDKTPKNIEALMFGLYLMAVTSMEENDVMRMFNESKQHVLTRYLSATQQALVNASFMRVDDAILLQAYVLYLVSTTLLPFVPCHMLMCILQFAVRWFVDPRQVFCMIGIALRIAQRMGLHRDPGGYGLPPFEVEQRRRLWWTLVGYDRRIGEMTGSTVTALSSNGDCKMPLNVNDSDLHMDGTEMPTPHKGPTEMLFALARIEMSMAVSSNSNRDGQAASTPDSKGGAGAKSEQKAAGPTIQLATADSPTYTLDGFCAHIEGTYLAQCDNKIPLHFFTLTMTRQALCKMRVLNFLVRMNNAEAMPLKEVEREDLFLQATQMIEYDNVVQSSESLKPFQWYARHHFPFPAYMFIVQELRTRTTGPEVERAWDAIASNYELRGLINNFHNPMHFAFKNNFIKAWDAHRSAQQAIGKQPATPRFIAVLQERAEQRRKEKGERQRSMYQSPASSVMGSSSVRSDQTARTPPSMPGMQMGPPDDDQDMDWSYMVQSFQNPAPSYNNNVGNFDNFGPPISAPGAMPAMGPPMGGPPGSSSGASGRGMF